jgi:hypothetical protein
MGLTEPRRDRPVLDAIVGNGGNESDCGWRKDMMTLEAAVARISADPIDIK